MIVLTVKTLDSQNHTFTVDDDITVEQFKAKIADTVNIPAETQRIIYCGRVLQDSSKLSDYDVNGKVVHLVQRAPPSQNPPTTRSSSPPSPRRGGFRGFETGNTMYLGSMAFPSNLMESQGIVPPPPTHSLAGSRLNVAKRMLRRAEAVINLLENPSARPSEQASSEEQNEEEVTPIIEARVIVPRGDNDTIDEAMVLSAVQNTLFDAATGTIPMSGEVTIETTSNESPQSSSGSAASTPEDEPQQSSAGATASENGQQRAGVSARSLAENASRTSEMSDLLTTLNQLQSRFQPFLERYRQFMADDPIIPQDDVRQTQAMLTRVSEVMHFLGHAYHSLSDIIIRVRTPPPRPLLCRPILIQHSAVVQAGIPIQVEAQINLATERPTSTTSSTTDSNASTTATTTNSTGNQAQSSTTTTTTSSSNSQQPTVNIRGFPFLPPSMHIQALRAAQRINFGNRPQNNNNNTVNNEQSSTTTTTASNNAPTSSSSSTTSDNNGSDGGNNANRNGGGGSSAGANFFLPNLNNSSVEFFMEVTPEAMQGGMNGPPPEFLQSIVQMAGQIMSRVATSNNAGGNGATAASNNANPSSANSTAANNDQSSANSSQSAGIGGQNSQARGNTQTHPTTATHTRSTARPHVHLAQQAMQGGFDPFLPCNSHHVMHRRRQGVGSVGGRQQQNGQQRRNASATDRSEDETTQGLNNMFDEIYNSLRRAYGRNRGGSANGSSGSGGGAGRTTWHSPQGRPTSMQSEETQGESGSGGNNQRSGTTAARNNAPQSVTVSSGSIGIGAFDFSFPNMPEFLDELSSMESSTVADLIQQLPLGEESSDNQPGSLINDLIYMLSRTLTLVDMVEISRANYEPLVRIRSEIRDFMVNRLVEGSTNINAGVDTILTELQPFFQHFTRLNVRENIDILRSMENLFRQRLPEIFSSAINLNSDAGVQNLVEMCVTLVKLMFTLAVNASVNGRLGVEELFAHIFEDYLQGIPDDLRDWTTASSRENLRRFLSHISSQSNPIDGYIVRNSSDVAMETSSTISETQNSKSTQAAQRYADHQPMDLDEPMPSSGVEVAGAGVASGLTLNNDEESLPAVVVGSESWHNDVPEDWVPIIARDVTRQRRQNSQQPFSDAYLSGMPTKRRKIVNSAKPQGSLPQVIADSVRRAVTATGLAGVAPIEIVSQAAGDSGEVQTAYRSLLRTAVQSTLRDNEDFTPERFPNASTYFKPE